MLLAFSVTIGQAQVTVTNSFHGVNKLIPDGSAAGVADTRRVFVPEMAAIIDVEVRLTVEGGMNGDLYCYLVHESGFVVLVNRPGVSSSNPMGYEDSGFAATFNSQATNDFHCYRDCDPHSARGTNSAVAGVWAPDGRQSDPAGNLDNAARVAGLGSFAGLNPNGEWTLFAADLSSGAQATLKDWGLVITGIPVENDLRLAKNSTPAQSTFRTPLLAHSILSIPH